MWQRPSSAGTKMAVARRVSGSLGLVCGVLLFALPAFAGPTKGDWEFHVFGGKATLDSSDPFEGTLSGFGDFGSGTATHGTLTRSLHLSDDAVVGFRLGYMWEPRLETELSYDRNHTSSDFEQTIEDLGSGQLAEEVHGSVSSVFTAYQVGILYHPLAYWRTPWQPYVTITAGWIDVDFSPSKSLEAELQSGKPAEVFHADLAEGDESFMLGYGLGIKYYVNENVALRADFRAKSYDLFEDRRMDREISIGVSFFAPGQY